MDKKNVKIADLELSHALIQHIYRQQMITDTLLLSMVVLGVGCCVSSCSSNLVEGDIVMVVIMSLLGVVNIFNGLKAIQRLLKTYKDKKTESLLWEEFQTEMAEFGKDVLERVAMDGESDI